MPAGSLPIGRFLECDSLVRLLHPKVMTFLETFASDVGYAVRTLRRVPGFTALAVLIVALGIGANTAIFSLVSAVLLEPLPFVDLNELVFLWEDSTAVGGPPAVNLAPATYVDLQERSRSFEDMAAFAPVTYNLTGNGEPEQLGAQRAVVARRVLVGALGLAGLGLAAGVGSALAIGRLLESFLFEVRAMDPLTLILASALLLLVSAVASYVPARRASTVEPMAALRDE